MLTVNEVWNLIDEKVKPLPGARVSLEQALHGILQEPVIADADQPAFHRSAIDGYAVPENGGAGRYHLAGEVKPGAPFDAVPRAGEAWKIFTGSALPESGVALVMIEDTVMEGNDVILQKAPSISLIRRRGSQSRKGDVLMEKGAELGPGALSVLASVGAATPLIIPPVCAAHVVTGTEIIPVTEVPATGFIRDSNSPLIAGLLADVGARRVFHHHVTEDVEETVRALRKADESAFSLLLISGGASVGAYDGTKGILERLGFTIHCSKVRSRPGKPMIFATRAGQVAFGLPGNPLSHFVCFHLFVRRAIDRLMGRRPVSLLRLGIDGLSPKPDTRETWWPARISCVEGVLIAKPLPWKDSSDLTCLARANGLLRVPSEAGNGLVEAILFGKLET